MNKLLLAAAILIGLTSTAQAYTLGYETLLTSRLSVGYYAQDAGLFAKEGLDIEVINNSIGGIKNLALLSSGRIDFASADFSAVINHNNTVANDLVVVYVPSDATELSLLSRHSRDINFYDGKTIATGKTGVTTLTFPFVFPEVSPAFVYMGLTLRIPAMLSGKTDALLGFAGTMLYNIAYSEDTSGIKVIKYADYEPRFIGPSIMVRKEFLKNNPEIVASFVRVYDNALKESIKDRTLTINSVVSRSNQLSTGIETARYNYVVDNFVLTSNVLQNGLNNIDESRIAFYANKLVPNSTLVPSDYYAKITY